MPDYLGTVGVGTADARAVMVRISAQPATYGPHRTGRKTWVMRFAARRSGLAFGLALGDVGAGGLIDGLLGRGAVDPAVLVVLIQCGGVTMPEAEGGGVFPG